MHTLWHVCTYVCTVAHVCAWFLCVYILACMSVLWHVCKGPVTCVYCGTLAIPPVCLCFLPVGSLSERQQGICAVMSLGTWY